MGKNVLLSEEREIPILFFLWKWKVSTTAALIKKFFPHCAGKTAYNRILSLRQAGLIQLRSDSGGQKFICSLDKQGFETIRKRLTKMKEEGYKSEYMGHDLVASAFQLGDWLIECPKGVSFFTEQELRRIDPGLYPEWVPKSEVHRPDGYSRITMDGKPATVAFEAELNQKSDAEYERVAEHYDLFRTILRVFWLMPRESTAKNLHQKLKKYSRRVPSPHNFLIFEEFQNQGWQSKILFGPDEGKTLSEVLAGLEPQSRGSPPAKFLAQSLLDLRKSPHVAVSYRGYRLGDFSN